MNSIINNLLFGNTNIREYATVTLTNEIKERVYLEVNEVAVNVSSSQWLLCLYPAIFGIWLANGKINIPDYQNATYKMVFHAADGKSVANLTLTFFSWIDENAGSLLLLKLDKSQIHHLHTLKARLLYHKYYKKQQFTFEVLKAFASAYSYPRRVRLISFNQDDYYGIFPMDLVGEIPQANRFVFGLRHTNVVLSKIIEARKLVVSNVGFKHKDTIYRLGLHHSTLPPPVDQLPFKVYKSETFNFYVPEWAYDYTEINILKTINLGSHMLLWGEVQNKCVLKPAAGHLFHIHYLLYLYQKRNQSAYRIV